MTYLINPFLFSNPASIPNLRSWFDADDASTITESSGSVSIWGCKAQGVDADQATPSLRPQTGVGDAEINGKNAIRFVDNSDSLVLTTSQTGLTNLTVIGVAKPNAYTTTSNGVMVGRVGVNNQVLRYSNTTSYARFSVFDGSNSTVGTNFGSDQTGVARILSVIYNASGSSVTMRINGSQVKIGTYDGTIEYDSMCYFSSTSAAGLDIGEILIYDRVLSGAEIAHVESYLKRKWNII